jgi:NADH dehydrogenase FAD-containing subunit
VIQRIAVVGGGFAGLEFVKRLGYSDNRYQTEVGK